MQLTVNDINKLINDAIDVRQRSNQYAVVPIAAHQHNGVDSLQVSFSNVTDRVFTFSHTLYGTTAATAANYSVFFIAPFALRLTSVTEAHTTKGSDGSAVTLNIEKLTGTAVPAAGTNLLSTTIDLKGNNNTVQTGSIAGTVSASLNIAAGDRLALVLTGTPTALTNVCVSLVLLVI